MAEIVQKAEAPNPPTNPLHIQQYALDSFHHLFVQFLDALAETFEDTALGSLVREQKLKYDMAITHCFNSDKKIEKQREIMKVYHTQMKPHFNAVNDNNLDFAGEVDILKEINMEKILEQADVETKETILEYLKNMNQSAIMYSVYDNIPTGLLSSIGNVAQNMQDPTQLDMASVSQSLMSEVNQNDIQKFAMNMVENQSALQDLCTLAASSLKQQQNQNQKQ